MEVETEITSSLAFRKLFDKLDAVDDILTDGPDDDEAPESFRKRICDKLDEARSIASSLTDDEVDAEYTLEEGDE